MPRKTTTYSKLTSWKRASKLSHFLRLMRKSSLGVQTTSTLTFGWSSWKSLITRWGSPLTGRPILSWAQKLTSLKEPKGSRRGIRILSWRKWKKESIMSLLKSIGIAGLNRKSTETFLWTAMELARLSWKFVSLLNLCLKNFTKLKF